MLIIGASAITPNTAPLFFYLQDYVRKLQLQWNKTKPKTIFQNGRLGPTGLQVKLVGFTGSY